MKVSEIDLRAMLEFRPSEGKLLLGADRMLLFRQAAFGVLRSLLFERFGIEVTNSILAQFGYRSGAGDYQALTTMFEWDTVADRIAAGPVTHSWEGIVLAMPEKLEFDMDSGAFHMLGTWDNSYEAEIHREHIGESDVPVCFTLTGYASGYASAFMGRPMLCVETECAAVGGSRCRWEIRPTHEWDERAEPYKRSLEATSASIQKELERSLAQISAPMIRIWDGILAVPLIGKLDMARTDRVTDTLLGEVARTSARAVILDVTGVEAVDEGTANGILQVVSAVKLLGAQCHLSGVRGDVARMFASTSLDLTKLRTFATLKQALQYCLPRATSH